MKRNIHNTGNEPRTNPNTEGGATRAAAQTMGAVWTILLKALKTFIFVGGISGWMDDRFPKITMDGADGDECASYVANIRDGASAGFKYFDCRGVKAVSITTRAYADGVVAVKTAWDGPALCRIPVHYTNIWTTATASVEIPDGVQALYFTFEGEGAMSLATFALHK